VILTLDVGNSQLYGGLFDGDELKFQFRKSTQTGASSDELGLFLKAALRENGFDPGAVRQIGLCSVVPDVVHSLKGACLKYFGITPFALLPGVKTGLRIKIRNPIEVGADRIADAIGANFLYPGKNLIIVDMGTATTYSVLSAEKDYLGGLIMPGLRISMEALETKTAKLPSVEIVAPEELVGRSTVESIQSGLYYGTLHALVGVSKSIAHDYFNEQNTLVIGTGGFSRLFEKEKVFDHLVPELVLIGIREVLKMNF
jgi:type III pantothenate kinase